MSDNLILETRKTGDGRTLALINGKLYTLLSGYHDHRARGWFFLAVAGRTPLKADDLAEHWQMVKSGQVYLACAQQLSRFILQSEIGLLLSAGLIPRDCTRLYCLAPPETAGLLAELVRNVARVIGVPDEPSCRHVSDRRGVAAGWGVQHRERYQPVQTGSACEGPGAAQIVLNHD